MPVPKLRAILLIGVAVAGNEPLWAQDASTLPFQKSEPAKPASPQLKAGANSFAESQARSLLESKGYSRISTLMNDPDGIWRGTAMKDDKQVDVSVDFQGHVAVR